MFRVSTDAPCNEPENDPLITFLWTVALGLDSEFEEEDGTGVGSYGSELEPYDWVNESTEQKIKALLFDRFRFSTSLDEIVISDELSRLNDEQAYIIESIDNNHPVLISMYRTDDNEVIIGGHIALIDQYKLEANGNFSVRINMGWGPDQFGDDGASGKWYSGTGSIDAAQNRNYTKFYVYKNLRPNREDTDGDDMLDSWEMLNFGNLTRAGTGDYDDDGLTDLEEFQRNTDPKNSDTDDDLMPDGWEVTYGLDPFVNDSSGDWDGDELTNLDEYTGGSDPTDYYSVPADYPVVDWKALIQTDNYSWADFSEIHTKESMFAIICNCMKYDDYEYTSNTINEEVRKKIKESSEWAEEPWVIDILADGADGNKNYPVVHNEISGQLVVTPWADGIWNDDISNKPKFNTVYKRFKPGERFEVLSHVDEDAPVFVGTNNNNSNFYFFTYRTKALIGDQAGTKDDRAVTLEEWIDYLEKIVEANEYHPIDTLTIFAHGDRWSPEICMSEEFHLIPESLEDTDVKSKLERLRNILSNDASILLFVCWAGKESSGESFVQTLADITNATVYANSDSTGGLPLPDSLIEMNDINDSMNWDLDVVRTPSNYVPDYSIESFLESGSNITKMFPGGLVVTIEADTLNADGKIVVTSTNPAVRCKVRRN